VHELKSNDHKIRVNHVHEALAVYGHNRKRRKPFGAFETVSNEAERDVDEDEAGEANDYEESETADQLPVDHEAAFLASPFHEDLVSRASETGDLVMADDEHHEDLVPDPEDYMEEESFLDHHDHQEDKAETKILRKRYGWRRRKRTESAMEESEDCSTINRNDN
jgi:hypothetical protein